ncbi:MAG: FtsX-like permease family protein [Acidobacteria bacterium]|nr:FtsX-like permease family protein [Acidobacteriota bacterium]
MLGRRRTLDDFAAEVDAHLQLEAERLREQGLSREEARAAAVDPTIPVYGAQTLDEAVAASLTERRFAMAMVGLFALTALLLAGLGIYGVLSYVVGERTHEIGIRVALGARRRSILRLVLGQGLALAGAGVAAGLASSLVVTHLMAGLLYGVSPTDPLTFAGVAALLVAVALLACYLPAQDALRVHPMVALRSD